MQEFDELPPHLPDQLEYKTAPVDFSSLALCLKIGHVKGYGNVGIGGFLELRALLGLHIVHTLGS